MTRLVTCCDAQNYVFIDFAPQIYCQSPPPEMILKRIFPEYNWCKHLPPVTEVYNRHRTTRQDKIVLLRIFTGVIWLAFVDIPAHLSHTDADIKQWSHLSRLVVIFTRRRFMALFSLTVKFTSITSSRVQFRLFPASLVWKTLHAFSTISIRLFPYFEVPVTVLSEKWILFS